jgi:hypothetical protein
MASSQDKVQHYLGQLDKEVCTKIMVTMVVPAHRLRAGWGPQTSPCPHTSFAAVITMTDTLQLSKYPALQNLEKQTNVPKTYAVIGAVTLYFFFIVFNLGGQLLTNLAGFAIPGYYSLNALFTASKTDDTQWLTVSCAFTDPRVAIWAVRVGLCANHTLSVTVLGCFLLLHVSSHVSNAPGRGFLANNSFPSVLESLLSVVYWFPFYYTFKFVFLLWLALPTFRYVQFSTNHGQRPREMSPNAVIGVPILFSAPSWLPRSVVTSAALPLLACVLRPTRPSKRFVPQDLPTNRGRAWPLKPTLRHLLGSESARMSPWCT